MTHPKQTSDIQTKLVEMMNTGVDNKVIAEACNHISLLEHRLGVVADALVSRPMQVEIMTDEELMVMEL